jgi:hypothetical protein
VVNRFDVDVDTHNLPLRKPIDVFVREVDVGFCKREVAFSVIPLQSHGIHIIRGGYRAALLTVFFFARAPQTGAFWNGGKALYW